MTCECLLHPEPARSSVGMETTFPNKAFIKDELKSCHICVLVALAAVIVTTSFSKGLEFCILFGILRLQGLFGSSLRSFTPLGPSGGR